MAGKSGRTISNVPESPVKRTIMSWEGILVLVLILVNIFCACFSEFYNIGSLLNQMPIYLAEVFLMLPMASQSVSYRTQDRTCRHALGYNLDNTYRIDFNKFY